MEKKIPSMDEWLREAKEAEGSSGVGMYLVHNGVVRVDARDKVRNGKTDAKNVRGMRFSSDEASVRLVEEEIRRMPGIFYFRVWLNDGILKVGDDIMFVMVGGDTRSHVVDALQYAVGKLKSECVTEEEIFE